MDEIKYFCIFMYVIGLYALGTYIHVLYLSEYIEHFAATDEIQPVYDYIIVGGGSAGSVVALRLAATKSNKILLLEAGCSGGALLDIPIVGPALQHTPVDWQYETVPQENACLGLQNKKSKWPMGQILGGTGRLNNMLYVRGHSQDYREWVEDASNYNFDDDILPYFKRSENQQGRFRNDSKYHSSGGPVIVSDLPFVSNLANAVLQAAEILGFPVRDLNGHQTTGFMEAQVNTLSGRRYTPAHHLHDQKLPNVQIVSQALVHGVLLKDGYEVHSVTVEHFGTIHHVRSRHAIILSAGTVGTPKILMLSGIGPKKHLQSVGVGSIIDLPVGENLQDHVTTGLDLILLNSSLTISLESTFYPTSAYDYVFYGSGPLASPGCEVVGLVNTSCVNGNCSGDVPDLQLMVIPLGISADAGYHFQKIMNVADYASDYFHKLLFNTTVSILPILLHPKSVGYVRLKDKCVGSKPLINPKYLSDPYDVEILTRGIETIKKLITTEPLQKFGAKLNENKFPGCESFEFDTASYWECYVRHLTLTSYHPVGTCKMGSASSRSVVDFNFKVYSTNKLFVVDASVMPSLPSGNINAAVTMLAEMAVDSIKRDRFLLEGCCNVREIFVERLMC